MSVARLFPILLALLSACSNNETKTSADSESQPRERAELDPKAAAEALAVVESATPEAMPVIAARVLSELEEGRIPPGLREALVAVAEVPPDTRVHMVAPGLSEPGALAAVGHACGKSGNSVMPEFVNGAPDQLNEMLWTNCRLERLGLVSAAQLSSIDPTMLLLAHVIFDDLRASGGVDPNERKLLEHMLAAPR